MGRGAAGLGGSEKAGWEPASPKAISQGGGGRGASRGTWGSRGGDPGRGGSGEAGLGEEGKGWKGGKGGGTLGEGRGASEFWAVFVASVLWSPARETWKVRPGCSQAPERGASGAGKAEPLTSAPTFSHPQKWKGLATQQIFLLHPIPLRLFFVLIFFR